MKLFHRHQFVEKERFITPSSGIKKLSGGNPEDTKKLVFGVTTILYICEECGKVNTIEVLGEKRK